MTRSWGDWLTTAKGERGSGFAGGALVVAESSPLPNLLRGTILEDLTLRDGRNVGALRYQIRRGIAAA